MPGISALYPYIKPYAQGVPDVAITAELILAAKELAKKTLAFRDEVLIDAQAGWGMYDIGAPASRYIEAITKVCVNGREVPPLASKPCDGCAANGFWVDRNVTLQIYPAPWQDEVDGISVEYAFSPRLDSCEIDSDMLERYANDLAHAVLSRLLMMKDQKWYDPKAAQLHAAAWERAKVSALTDGISQYSRGAISIDSGSNYLDS